MLSITNASKCWEGTSRPIAPQTYSVEVGGMVDVLRDSGVVPAAGVIYCLDLATDEAVRIDGGGVVLICNRNSWLHELDSYVVCGCRRDSECGELFSKTLRNGEARQFDLSALTWLRIARHSTVDAAADVERITRHRLEEQQT